MQAEVFYNNTPVGTIDWTPNSRGVEILLDCALCGTELLRCYGICGGNTLRIGLPAPEHGRLRLRRQLSRETLRAAGCVSVPERFYLAAAPETISAPLPQSNAPPATPFTTGDSVLDALLTGGEVQLEQIETGVRLSCPFDPKKPFALAPAFVLCRVQGNTAVLEWKKDAAGEAASS